MAPIAFASLGFAAYLAGMRVNTTNSMPEGLWWVGSIDHASLHRGQVVTFCLPEPAATFAQERGYIGSGPCPENRELLVKPIAAVPGDRVDLSADGVSVNDIRIPHSEIAGADRQSRPVPSVPFGTYTIAPGTVFMVTTRDPLSFDSRYFGAVPIANLRGVALPVLVSK